VPEAPTNVDVDPRSASGDEAKRDDRLDFFRGVALRLIFIDHLPDITTSYIIARSFVFCDSEAGEIAGVPLLGRYELMQLWSDSDFLGLDATAAEERVLVERVHYDCMAEICSEQQLTASVNSWPGTIPCRMQPCHTSGRRSRARCGIPRRPCATMEPPR
jgi:hypothetical protein